MGKMPLNRALWRMACLVFLWFSGRWRALAKGTAWAGFYRAILLLLPLSPLPCKAAAPKGPAFCFLNYFIIIISKPARNAKLGSLAQAAAHPQHSKWDLSTVVDLD